jgi:Rrf2 family protein
MIQVSTHGRYALRLLLDLAYNQHENVPVLREEIAARQGVSAYYTAQLFRKLGKAGLTHGVMGPGGGYLLSRPANEIRVGDIIRATEGPIALVHCVAGMTDPACCEKQDTCISRGFWEKASRELEHFFDSITLIDLLKDANSLVNLERGMPPLEEPVDVQPETVDDPITDSAAPDRF